MSSTTLRTAIIRGVTSRHLQIAATFLLFMLTRIVFILRYPVFNDEAIYMRYGKIMIESAQRFYSVSVIGKQPLMYWLYAFSGKVIDEPLLGARFISLGIGILGFYGLYGLTKQVAGHGTALLACLIYVGTPMFLLFDGLAVVDGALVCLVIWVLWLGLSLIKRFTWWKIGVLGFQLGLAFWIKTTGLVLAPVILFAVLLTRINKKTSTEFAILSLFVVYFIAFFSVAPLVFRSEFESVLKYQRDYALTIQEVLAFPLAHWAANSGYIAEVFFGYLLPFTPLMATVAIVRKYRDIQVIFLVLSFFALLAPLVLTARGIQMRYVVFSAVPLLPLAAMGIRRYTKVGAFAVGIMIVAATILAINAPLFFQTYPQKSVYAGENWQYIKGWPSGYGVMEALAFVDRDRNGRPVFVGVRWDSGNPEDTILLYAAKIPGMSTMFFDPKMEEFPNLVRKYSSIPMYFITRDHQTAGLDKYLLLLQEFKKPNSQESVKVYRFSI